MPAGRQFDFHSHACLDVNEHSDLVLAISQEEISFLEEYAHELESRRERRRKLMMMVFMLVFAFCFSRTLCFLLCPFLWGFVLRGGGRIVFGLVLEIV